MTRLALSSRLIGRLRISSTAARQGAAVSAVRASTLSIPGLAPGGILVVRRTAIEVDTVGRIDVAVTTELEEAMRGATRPRAGWIPGDATGVLFQDEAELLACLLSDLLADRAGRVWWWQHLDLPRPLTVETAIEHNPRPTPAAFARLARWGRAVAVADRVPRKHRARLAQTIAAHHALPVPPVGHGMPSDQPTRSSAGDPDGRQFETVIDAVVVRTGGRPVFAARPPDGRRETPDRSTEVRPSVPFSEPSNATEILPPVGPDQASPASGEGRDDHAPTWVDRHGHPPARTDREGSTDPAAEPLDSTAVDRGPGSPTEEDTPIGARPRPSPVPRSLPPAVARETTPLVESDRPRHGDQTDQRSVDPPNPIMSNRAGSFYLLNAIRHLNVTEALDLDATVWEFMCAVLRSLDVEIVDDPLWPLLGSLCPESPSERSGGGVRLPDTWWDGDGDVMEDVDGETGMLVRWLPDRFVCAMEPGGEHRPPRQPRSLPSLPPPSLSRIDLAAHLFASFLTDRLGIGTERLLEMIATPGAIHATATHIDVVMALEAVDLVARRHGLDADPGWYPEAGRVVRFHFGGRS